MITPILSADTTAERAANFPDNITENSVLCSDGAIAYFKGWVNRKMKVVATKYLSNYLAWFRESNEKLNKQEILVAAYC
jgi:hypothetical protein